MCDFCSTFWKKYGKVSMEDLDVDRYSRMAEAMSGCSRVAEAMSGCC